MRVSKDSYLRYTAQGLIMLFLFIFQSTPGLLPQFYGALPLLLIPFVCSVALFEGETTGAYFGLAAGILLDMYSPYSGPVGAFTLFIAGCVCGLLSKHLMLENFLSALTFTVFTLFTYLTIYWLVFYVFAGAEKPIYYYLNHQLPTFAYSAIFLIPVYYAIRAVTKKMRN